MGSGCVCAWRRARGRDSGWRDVPPQGLFQPGIDYNPDPPTGQARCFWRLALGRVQPGSPAHTPGHLRPPSLPSTLSSLPPYTTYLMSLLPCADHTLPPVAAARRRPCRTNAMVGLSLCGCVGVVEGVCSVDVECEDDDDDGGVRGLSVHKRSKHKPLRNHHETYTNIHDTDARIGAGQHWTASAPPHHASASLAHFQGLLHFLPRSLHRPPYTATDKPLDACQPRHHNHDNLHHLLPPGAPIECLSWPRTPQPTHQICLHCSSPICPQPPTYTQHRALQHIPLASPRHRLLRTRQYADYYGPRRRQHDTDQQAQGSTLPAYKRAKGGVHDQLSVV